MSRGGFMANNDRDFEVCTGLGGWGVGADARGFESLGRLRAALPRAGAALDEAPQARATTFQPPTHARHPHRTPHRP